MAKGKKSSGKNYVSKGQRPNVSRKIRNMVKRARREDRPVEDILKSDANRQRILEKPAGEKERSLRDRYREEDRVAKAAALLFKQFENQGMSWAAAVQAVKTDKVPEVTEKYLHKQNKRKEASKKRAS